MSRKILNHPDKNEIIAKLLRGESTTGVSEWLQDKYPNARKKRISWITLQEFRKNYLKLEGEALRQVKEDVKRQKKAEEKKKNLETVKKTSAYKEKVQDVANSYVDVQQRIIQLDRLIQDRLESYFNLIEKSNSNVRVNEDRVLIKYIEQQRGLMHDWKKIVEGIGSDSGNGNAVSAAMLNEQVTRIRAAIQRVISKFDPGMAMEFVEDLCKEFKELETDNSSFNLMNMNVVDVDEQ